MKFVTKLMLLFAFVSLFGACSSDDLDLPYVIYKDSSGAALSSFSPISVTLNSTVVIYAEAGYDRSNSNRLNYEWKIDNGSFEKYSGSEGLDITTIGGHNNLSVEKATLELTFSDDLVESGSQVIIRIRDMDSMSKELTFNVH